MPFKCNSLVIVVSVVLSLLINKVKSDQTYKGFDYQQCVTTLGTLEERQACIVYVIWESLHYPTSLAIINAFLQGQFPPFFSTNVDGRIVPLGILAVPEETLEYLYGAASVEPILNHPEPPTVVIFDTYDHYVISSGDLVNGRWDITLGSATNGVFDGLCETVCTISSQQIVRFCNTTFRCSIANFF